VRRAEVTVACFEKSAMNSSQFTSPSWFASAWAKT